MYAEDKRKLTFDEYLAFEREADVKHEYVAGDVLMMAGAKWRHNVITKNITVALDRLLLPKGCTPVSSDMQVYMPAVDVAAYPDVLVVCGEPEFYQGREDILLNPTLIVEVLSPSTQNYDRAEKFGYYRTLSSLRAYVIIAQSSPQIERYLRQPGGPGDSWLYSVLEGLEGVLPLGVVEGDIALAEVYQGVSFDASASDDAASNASEA